MTPETDIERAAEYTVYPDKTYHIDLKNKRICGFCDGEEAMRQAIYKIIATVRYEYIIYSGAYGTRIIDSMGSLTPFVWSELEREITRALLCDERINRVRDLWFEEDKASHILKVSFTAETVNGNFAYSQEVYRYV